jgi:flagellar biosynthesis anti-sigma factor FlgM
MRIPLVTEAYSAEVRKVDSQKRNEKLSAKPKSSPSDRSEFSSDATKRLSETKGQIDIVSTQLRNSPDVRPEKIAEAKQKIADGFYNSPEVADRLADALLEEFGFRKPSA